jgi:hypothetical protein
LRISPSEGEGLTELIDGYALEDEEIALMVVNWDGSVITRQGLVDVLSKGDSCLMNWQMVRKQDPVSSGGSSEPLTAPGMSAAPSSKKVVGGVAVDLPF